MSVFRKCITIINAFRHGFRIFEVPGVNATDDNSDSARPEEPRGVGFLGRRL
jgi:hypothetical protein